MGNGILVGREDRSVPVTTRGLQRPLGANT
jgi:hypothetical protein